MWSDSNEESELSEVCRHGRSLGWEEEQLERGGDCQQVALDFGQPLHGAIIPLLLQEFLELQLWGKRLFRQAS